MPAKTTAVVQFGIRIPEPVYKQLRALAEREGRSMNSEVNRMLRVHLDANMREKQ